MQCNRCRTALTELNAPTVWVSEVPYAVCPVCGERRMLGDPVPLDPNPIPPQRVVVVWSGAGPALAEIAAIRKLFPDYAERPVSDLAAQLRGTTELFVGVFLAYRANELKDAGEALGLHIRLLPTGGDD
jgi:hypothetical protein